MDQAIYLNVGCGKQPISGFVNIDLEPDADLQIDVTKGLPFPDRVVAGIYSEHFIEHISQGQAVSFLRECRRVLAPGGVVRLATPDLDEIVARYSGEQWLGSGMKRHGYDWVENPCEMLNINMREWGHQWLFNEHELVRLGRMSGLELVGRFELNVSSDPMLAQRETRPESMLIVEFRKPLLDPLIHPLVSILIPAYNPRYFTEALESALGQTYTNLEIIVCDDNRNGEIRAIVDHYMGRDSRVRYFYNDQQLGGRKNYLRCFAESSGELIKYLNDDDLLSHDCVEQMVAVLREHPDVTLVTSHRQLIDATGAPLPDNPSTQRPVELDSLLDGPSLAGAVLASRINFIGEPTTVMFRRRDVEHASPDMFSFGNVEAFEIGDVALWLNLLSRGDAYYIVETLSSFRKHDSQRQEQAGVRETALRSWQAMVYQGARLGLLDPQSPGPLKVKTGDEDFDLSRYMPHDGADTTAQGYAHWRDRHALTEAGAALRAERMMTVWRHTPSVHVLALVNPGQEPLLAQTMDSLAQQLYKGWGLTIVSSMPCPEGSIEADAPIEWIVLDEGEDYVQVLNRAIRDTGADWLCLLDPGDRLASEAFVSLGDYANLREEWQFIYVDEDCLTENGEHRDPRFKPDLNVELLRCTPYTGRACFVRREALEAVSGLRLTPGVELHDVLFRILERFGESAVGHVPEMLYHQHERNGHYYLQDQVIENGRRVILEHLERVGEPAEVSTDSLLKGSYFVDYLHPEQPLVSIIIPTKNRLDLLKPCVESLLAKTRYPNYEVLVVDNNSDEPATLEYLDALEVGSTRVRVLRYPRPYNFSAINNFAAREAAGEYLLLLNNDTQIVQPQWLDRMMAQAQRPDVGIVGARLVFADQRIQHAGVVLGMVGAADHIHIGLPMQSPGLMGRTLLTQNFSAVTAACLAIKRSVYEEVGGLDEVDFKVLFNDVDLCLKVGEQGYKIVWTPYATVVHHGSSSLKSKSHQQQAPREPVEAWAMFEKWLPRLAADPAYNRNLSLPHRDARPEIEIVPGWNADFRDRPRILGFPQDRWGCGEYRIRAPLNALEQGLRAQVSLVPVSQMQRIPQIAELARLAPDTLLLQSFLHDGQLQALELYRRFLPTVHRVFELDDLKTQMPTSNPKSRTMYKDVSERLRRALSYCDRMIVSTETLRDAYADLIDEIVVVPNRLERARWGGLTSQRRVAAKPRVGWAGAQQHHGDLALMREVVEATASEVEWVFFGMCPPELRPHVTEFHEGVVFDRYPEKLASLNLDLAVAPLEINRFNEAKSNLRLLEYGIMGWPVVCTDIEPYRAHGAPVTRVTNDPAAWIEAIRDHAHDLDASEQAGNRLRQWVLRHWMLEDHLDEWLHALTSSDAGRTHHRIQRLA